MADYIGLSESEVELYHYGVPGMKWGVSKDEDDYGTENYAPYGRKQQAKVLSALKEARDSDLKYNKRYLKALSKSLAAKEVKRQSKVKYKEAKRSGDKAAKAKAKVKYKQAKRNYRSLYKKENDLWGKANQLYYLLEPEDLYKYLSEKNEKIDRRRNDKIMNDYDSGVSQILGTANATRKINKYSEKQARKAKAKTGKYIVKQYNKLYR